MQTVLPTMHGLNTDASTLNNEVANLLVPSALEATSAQLLVSTADPASSNANVKNPFVGRIELVVEALLDAVSATAYYGIASNSLIDTIAVYFLQGEEQPVLESWWDPRTDTRENKIRQTGAVVVEEYRGMVKNNGA
jgi:hypothetical protein